ncbi:hypothetical protein P20652_2635 [Pseudoalteromonas sp. BSi20652]|uniref:heme NO-binding domain-containing protein n=1 Tax=Pseudoalteromonas sp. BSi20652 TaxID=388384 RepID=UPI000231A65A|nr:heme NO-binding domain-containing protein [Pseudoalteromonas sp. BSi20652]GAA60768.1 hypothetical protein P20652_2635 [Pseudoalteromonas sp. BSi20652]
MKGIIFTEFLEMVENHFSAEVADQIIELNDLDSKGAYTSVGNYNKEELVKLITSLSACVNLPITVLLKEYGKYLLSRFVIYYPYFFKDLTNTFDFLDTIDRHVHVEVKKLYSNAELPSFQTKRLSRTQMQMFYQSSNPFALLADGLIEGAANHFGENIHVDSDISDNHQVATFTLTLVG